MKDIDTTTISLDAVSYSYSTEDRGQFILNNISLSIPSGQNCSIIGSSGSGKSTLLNLIGLLDTPTCGRVLINGIDTALYDANTRAIIRNRTIGFVFQSFNLLKRLNVLDNIALPLLYRGIARKLAREQAYIYLEIVGLGERWNALPADLSGGQRQKIAIARALVGKPSLLLADEPTGNLDSRNASDIINLLLTINQDYGTTLVVVTHDNSIAKNMSRCIHVSDGKIGSELND